MRSLVWKKAVVASLAAGGVAAGMGSAASATSAPPVPVVSQQSAEAQQLHALVTQLATEDEGLQATLQARMAELGITQAPVVEVPVTTETTAPGDPAAPVAAPPATSSDVSTSTGEAPPTTWPSRATTRATEPTSIGAPPVVPERGPVPTTGPPNTEPPTTEPPTSTTSTAPATTTTTTPRHRRESDD